MFFVIYEALLRDCQLTKVSEKELASPFPNDCGKKRLSEKLETRLTVLNPRRESKPDFMAFQT